MIDTFDTSVKLAGKLLLHQGRISLKEIQHIPFVEGEQEALAVAQNLIDKYDVEIVENTWNREITLHIRRPATRNRRASAARSSA